MGTMKLFIAAAFLSIQLASSSLVDSPANLRGGTLALEEDYNLDDLGDYRDNEKEYEDDEEESLEHFEVEEDMDYEEEEEGGYDGYDYENADASEDLEGEGDYPKLKEEDMEQVINKFKEEEEISMEEKIKMEADEKDINDISPEEKMKMATEMMKVAADMDFLKKEEVISKEEKIAVRSRSTSKIHCALDKRVTMSWFCIYGNCDAGAEGEHALQLDGHWLGGKKYRDYREGQCHKLHFGSVNIRAWKTIFVGTEEHDSTS